MISNRKILSCHITDQPALSIPEILDEFTDQEMDTKEGNRNEEGLASAPAELISVSDREQTQVGRVLRTRIRERTAERQLPVHKSG